MKRFILLSFFLFGIIQLGFSQKEYVTLKYPNGAIKSQGWLKNGKKTAYWKFYHPNGQKMKEGHYNDDNPIRYWYFYREDGMKTSEGRIKNGVKTDWWLFYDSNGRVDHKCQLKNGEKNGYCLQYKDSELIKAEKYRSGKKIKEWTDYKSFRKENKLSDLQ